jgi:hypothetical protein
MVCVSNLLDNESLNSQLINVHHIHVLVTSWRDINRRTSYSLSRMYV